MGATALCMLTALGVLDPPSGAQEASAFNTGRTAPVVQAAAQPGASLPAQVIPLGSAFGIKLFTDGVIVASLSDIYTENGVCCPAGDAGVKAGDYLIEADGVPVTSNSELARRIAGCEGRPIRFTLRRNGALTDATVQPVLSGDSFKTGMWIRDSAAGIGTLTFYDPETGRFAGLGHGICDMDVGDVMTMDRGAPAAITLCGIDRSQPGVPGQLRGYFSSESDLGSLLQNNETGVYGVLNETPRGQPIEVLPREEVHTGPVQIIATLDENGPRRYSAEIRRIGAAEQRTRNLVVRITDPHLIEQTGGIVQGMSGCPILQDGKLAGAITHVFTDDATTGYGIFAQTMLEELAALS